MKKLSIVLASVFMLAVIGCSKKSSSPGSTGTIYKGVVLHAICCQDVVQTIGPNYLGENSWTDSNSSSLPVYNHVFKVSNACQFGNHAVGDTISFNVVAQQVQNCACCNVFCYTPATGYPIQVTN